MRTLQDECAQLFIVDDEQDNLELAHRALKQRYRVRTFTDPREALRETTRHPPDALLVDLRMPFMSGSELLMQVRRAGVHCPALMLTGFAELEEVALARHAGLVTAVLPKPYGVEELRLQVRAVIQAMRRVPVVAAL
jgi:DNA-binding response OmpR family regulator